MFLEPQLNLSEKKKIQLKRAIRAIHNHHLAPWLRVRLIRIKGALKNHTKAYHLIIRGIGKSFFLDQTLSTVKQACSQVIDGLSKTNRARSN